MSEPLLVGVRQAAVIAGTGRDAMYELVRSGAVRSVRMGRRHLIPRTELEAWIEREMNGGEESVANDAGNGTRPPTDVASRA